MVEHVHKVGEEVQRGCGGRGNCSGNVGSGNVRQCREVACQDYRPQRYAFPGKNEAEVSDAVITCTTFFYD